MIYYIVFWILCFLAFIEICFDTGKQKILSSILVRIVLIFLILFAGFRNNGIDYTSYEIDFDLIKSGFVSIRNVSLEPGYSLLNFLLPTFRALLVVVAAFTIAFRFKAFGNGEFNCLFSLVFFYYSSDFLYYDMGIMRQGLSIGICLLSLRYIPTRDKRFFVLIGVAVCFHLSSLAFVLLYFFGGKEYSRKFYYSLLFASVIIAISGVVLSNQVVGMVRALGGDYINHKVSKYILFEKTSVIISVIRRVLFSILFIELFKNHKLRITGIRRREAYDNTWLYINGFFLSAVVFCVIGSVFSVLAGRATAVFYSLYIFVYGDIFKDRHHKLENIIWFVVFTVLAYDTFTGVLGNEQGHYLPYVSSIW